jgi:hypothetical protein
VLVVLPTIGTGADDDPIRVDMPTYRVVRSILNGRAAVVEIPDDDGPDPTDAPDPSVIAPGVLARLVDSLTPLQYARWRRRLDARYPQHAGQYRPVQGL